MGWLEVDACDPGVLADGDDAAPVCPEVLAEAVGPEG